MGNNRYVEDFLEYFDWNLEMESPSPSGGFVNKEDREADKKITLNENTDKN